MRNGTRIVMAMMPDRDNERGDSAHEAAVVIIKTARQTCRFR